jgi:hypothetical protein
VDFKEPELGLEKTSGPSDTTNYSSALQSILLLFFSYFVAYFLSLVIHEVGHGIMGLIKGYAFIGIFANPFLGAYAKIIPGTPSLEGAISGEAFELLVCSSISTIFWKHRSSTNLPLQMLFPTALVFQGVENTIALATPMADFNYVMNVTGLPAVVFYVIGIIFICLGIFIFNLLFPLLGLGPEDRKSLVVVPIGLSLYDLLVVIFAYLFAPAAIARGYMFLIIGGILGVILAVVYMTLYRRFYRRLPPSLQTEKADLTWRDLRIPGLLFTVLMVLGLLLSN